VKKQNSYSYTHKHSMFEFVYYCSGSGYTTVDGVKHYYSAGDFALIGPGVGHDEYRREETSVIYFGFFHYIDNIRLSTGMYRDEDGSMLHLLQQMIEEVNQKRSHFSLKLDLLLQCALIEIDRVYQKATGSDNEEKFIQTVKYIQQYYSEQLNLTQLANMSGYSYDHFRHLFLDYMGVTPMSYIIQLRLEKAKEMLVRKIANMTQISLECGFSSLSHFSSTFKKRIGKSPREYILEAEKEKRSGQVLRIHDA
jgi:AraC family transcriptional activator of pobA